MKRSKFDDPLKEPQSLGRMINYENYILEGLSEENQIEKAIQNSLYSQKIQCTQNEFLDKLERNLNKILLQKQQFYKKIVKEECQRQEYYMTANEQLMIMNWLTKMQKQYPNWRTKMLDPYIKSIKLNNHTNKFQFQTTKNQKESYLQHSHLSVPLYIYLIQNYNKDITFSLDPNPNEKLTSEQKMPKNMVKTHFIDKQKGKIIIGDTKFGDILFQADYQMKQLMLGVDQSGNQFNYPYQLLPILDKQFQYDQTKSNLGRYYLKVKQDCKMIQQKSSKDYTQFIFTNPIIQVQAQQMHIINGQMKDIPIQDTKSQCYQKAKSFTDNYDLISEYYPIFKKLKGCMLGLAFAKGVKNKITTLTREDRVYLQQLYKQQKMKDYIQKIPTIFGTKIKQNIIICPNQQYNDYEQQIPQIQINIQTSLSYVGGGVSCSLSNTNISTNSNKNIHMNNLNESINVYKSPSLINKSINLGRQYAAQTGAEYFTTKFAQKISKFDYSLARSLPFIAAISPGFINKSTLKISQFAIKSAIKASQYALKYGPSFSKVLAKKVPFVSLGVGIFNGIKRVIEGEYQMAFAEVCSGFAACASGAGTAISLGIDAKILTHDLTH